MISDRQNAEINIQRLAAQRYPYSKAKILHTIRFILTIPVILLLSILTSALKSNYITSILGIQTYDVSWLLGIVSILILVIDQFILEPIKQSQKKKAASIQEEFDCDVLQIPWNEVELPRHPTREVVLTNAKKYLDKYGSNGLSNWYPCSEDDQIPLSAARTICQRSNVTWDAKLRERYRSLILISGVSASAIIVLLAIIYDLSLREFLVAIAAPLLPIAGFVISEIRQNMSSIESLKEIRDCLEDQWSNVLEGNLSDDELLGKSRQLQDRIYARRKGSPFIPDWIYHKLRSSDEALMVATAEQMTHQYLSRGG